MSADASVPAAAVPPPAVVIDDAVVSPPPPAVPVPAAAPPPFVYAIGRIEPRFPSLAVEKELAQVTGRAETVGLTDSEVLRTVLADRSHRYLVRQLAWVFTVEGIETYLLVPRDPADLDLLVDAVRYGPKDDDRDVVIGIRGALAPADMARGLVVPVVHFDQIYSFDTDALISAIPRPAEIAADRFEAASRDLFGRVQLVADNAGATDEHRALNYLVVRYPRIYEVVAEALGRDSSLSAVDVRPSALSGARTVVDVVFDFTNRQTDVVESFFVRVDVTEEFPFLVTKLSPYYRR